MKLVGGTAVAPDNGVFRHFEREVIRLLAQDALLAAQLQALLAWHGAFDYQHTGVGYFLTVRDPGLPDERAVLSLPGLSGSAGAAACGFVAFLGEGEFTFECHTWDGAGLPLDFRERAVKVQVVPGEMESW